LITPRYRILIYTIFTLSGFTSLIYEILWAKQLSLVFGTSIIAVSIVAATFMGGLALGSILLGRYIDRHSEHLRTYALLELGIALCALSFPLGLDLIRSSYVDFSRIFPSAPLYAHTLQFMQTAVLLIFPAALMGGTFPALCRQFARRKCGGQIGRLYALNTVGATLGAFGSGYLLIPNLGLSGTNQLAIALNLVIVGAAWCLGGRLRNSSGQEVAQSRLTIETPRQRLVLAAVALTGFFSLAYEILWTRVLLLFLGNTSYAFALILSCFLVGLALGGGLYARLARPEMDEEKLYVLLTLLMGGAILLTTPFYDRLAYLFQAIHQVSDERWWLLSLLSWLAVLVILAVPAICSGALLPASVSLLDPGRCHTGSGVGLVVSHNTLGAVLGSLLAGFVMIPALGLQDSFRLLGFSNLVLAVVLMLTLSRHPIRVRAAILAAAACIAALLPGNWNPALMNSGIYCYAPKYAAMGGLESVLANETILETIEGRDTTVAIHESLDGRYRFFTVNGKTDGGTGSDTATQILIGHLPMLLHGSPEKTLVIGLGTGITLKGLSGYTAGTIDCVEISPEVIAAERYFSAHNGQALDDPKLMLIVNDGRNHLLAREDLYDVIISEPSNPWQSGNANLFTLEFYHLAARRLQEDGVFSQWIGLYDITTENLRIACNTLRQVFPHVLAFHSGSDLILLASKKQLDFDLGSMRKNLTRPDIRNTLASIGVNRVGDLFARHYLYGSTSLQTFSEGTVLNTDDRPLLEYSAHHNLGSSTLGTFQEANARALIAAKSPKLYLPLSGFGSNNLEISTNLRALGESYARNGQPDQADFFFNRAHSLRLDAIE